MDAANLLRGPYLQTVTPASIIIKWRTDIQTDAIVRYGDSPDALVNASAASTVGLDQEVELTGLSPMTRYYYSIGDSVGTLAGGDNSFTFRTAPNPDSAYATRVWVIGDSGSPNVGAANVRDAFINYTGSRSADLWLMLGDNAYLSGTDIEYQNAVFDTYPVLLRKISLWPAFGNHDGLSADSDSQSGPYYDIFSMPTNAEAGGLASGTEAYYSFDYGNIHFISLDSYDSDRSLDGTMLAWLDNDLAATTKDWVIAYWHHPPYTKGSHNSDNPLDSNGIMIDMRTNVVPILESHGVDLVLTGHSHSYERSFLLDGHYGSSNSFDSSMLVDGGSGRDDGTGVYSKNADRAAHEGTVYAVVGSSARLGGGSLDHPAMYISRNNLGSIVLDIDGMRMDAHFIDGSGAVLDYFSISKEMDTNINDPPFFTSTAVVDSTQNQLYVYDVTASDPDGRDSLTITAPMLPSWLTLTDHGNGTADLRGAPSATEIGEHSIELQVQENTSGLTGSQRFSLTVLAVTISDNTPFASGGGGSIGAASVTVILMLCLGIRAFRYRQVDNWTIVKIRKYKHWRQVSAKTHTPRI